MESGIRTDTQLMELMVSSLLYHSRMDTDSILDKCLLTLYDKEKFSADLFSILVKHVIPMLQLRLKIIDIHFAYDVEVQKDENVIDLQHTKYLKDQYKMLPELTDQYVELVKFITIFTVDIISGLTERNIEAYKIYLK
jgi:hypothetical protein